MSILYAETITIRVVPVSFIRLPCLSYIFPEHLLTLDLWRPVASFSNQFVRELREPFVNLGQLDKFSMRYLLVQPLVDCIFRQTAENFSGSVIDFRARLFTQSPSDQLSYLSGGRTSTSEIYGHHQLLDIRVGQLRLGASSRRRLGLRVPQT